MAVDSSPVPWVLRRPTSYAGWWGWVTTVDHKRIGILYGVTAIIFFLVGGLEAFILRLQLAQPGNSLVSPEVFSQLFTMHALTMIFLAIMPLGAAFFNVIIPLQIGARDVAFPRLNALSYWMFLFGGLLFHVSFLTGTMPTIGWFGYANLTSSQFSGAGTDYWIIGLLVLGTASLAASIKASISLSS